MSTDTVDIFDDVVSDNAETVESNDSTDEVTETPQEVLPAQPEGTVSITDFAAHMTAQQIMAKVAKGENPDGTEYVVPTSVYQTVKAKRDPIPHVLVKAEGDKEARVYILKAEATEWWLARAEKLSTRGQGTARASSRTAEQNLELLADAQKRALYALSRLALWQGKVGQTEKLVEKYKGFLKDQDASEEDVDRAIQDGTDRFNTEQAEKAAKKSKKSDEDSE